MVAENTSGLIGGKKVTLAEGSTFDFNTGIIEDVKLKAVWKHVHSYVDFQFGQLTKLFTADQIKKYGPYMHVHVCGYADAIEYAAHSYKNGVCTGCGYQKPAGSGEVSLSVTLDDGTPSKETKKKGSAFDISAPPVMSKRRFLEWQYYDGSNWKMFAKDSYVKFVLNQNLQVKAVYENVNTPKVTTTSGTYGDNVMFSLSYSMPDGYTVVDAGIIAGDNRQWCYVKTMDHWYDGQYYDRDDNAILSLGADTVLSKMLGQQPFNCTVKCTPMVRQIKNPKRSGSTSLLTSGAKDYPDRFIYATGYVFYKSPGDDSMKCLATSPIAATYNDAAHSAVATEN